MEDVAEAGPTRNQYFLDRDRLDAIDLVSLSRRDYLVHINAGSRVTCFERKRWRPVERSSSLLRLRLRLLTEGYSI